jgi:hypothetical protein
VLLDCNLSHSTKFIHFYSFTHARIRSTQCSLAHLHRVDCHQSANTDQLYHKNNHLFQLQSSYSNNFSRLLSSGNVIWRAFGLLRPSLFRIFQTVSQSRHIRTRYYSAVRHTSIKSGYFSRQITILPKL